MEFSGNQNNIDKSFVKPRRFGRVRFCSLILLIAFLIGIVYSGLQFKNYIDFLKSHENKDLSSEFEVKPGETLETVAKRLVDEGFLEDKDVFGVPAYKVYLKLNNFDSSAVQAGKFKLPNNATPDQIFDSFRDKGCKEIQLTLKEGWRIEEFADELAKNFSGERNAKFDKSQFIALARNYVQTPDLQLSFTPSSNLEGFLFPDTYRICLNLTSRQVIDTLLSNFDKKVYSSLSEEIKSSRFKLIEIVNIASMIEREARTPEEKRTIADIIIKRLDSNIPLGIDATTQYGFGYSTTQKTWWRTGAELDAVIDTNHQYSTRKNLGLPPTPISNPGLDSIRAVLEPIPNDYFFYITGKDGKMHYAKTAEEHNHNICRYLTMTCK